VTNGACPGCGRLTPGGAVCDACYEGPADLEDGVWPLPVDLEPEGLEDVACKILLFTSDGDVLEVPWRDMNAKPPERETPAAGAESNQGSAAAERPQQ